MILLLDCGNTLVKFAWLDNQHRHQAKALAHKNINDLPIQLQNTPTQVYGVNVASQELKQQLETICQQAWGLTINWRDYGYGHNYLKSDYAKSLGPDRWLAALGLLQHVQDKPLWAAACPHILASFGTATTIDTICLADINGAKQAYFLGGMILPGAQLMRTSLASGTARLPLADGQITDFPLNTHSAINTGVIAAQSGALYRQIQKVSLQYPGLQPQIYVCGGAWNLIGSAIKDELNSMSTSTTETSITEINNPVLDGLAMLAMSK